MHLMSHNSPTDYENKLKFFYPLIDEQYRVGLYTPAQTISSEINQAVKTIFNEIKNNLQ